MGMPSSTHLAYLSAASLLDHTPRSAPDTLDCESPSASATWRWLSPADRLAALSAAGSGGAGASPGRVSARYTSRAT